MCHELGVLNDDTLVRKMWMEYTQTAARKNAYYNQSDPRLGTFGVRHAGGEVTYKVAGFLGESSTQLSAHMMSFLKASTNPLLLNMMDHSPSSSSKTSSKRISSKLGDMKNDLDSILTDISASTPLFVRCISSNSERQASTLDCPYVLQQLRCSEIPALVKMTRLGYFFFVFSFLLHSSAEFLPPYVFVF
jgi:myosin heavy subunit